MERIVSFGYWVRRRRKALDLTQTTLARQVGCSLVMIRKIEGNERRPSRQMAELLADHLLIPEAERDHFLGMAHGEFIAAMPSPLEAVPSAKFWQEPDESRLKQETRFVAREAELAQLNAYLDLALAGQGRVAFVLGDAGQGKTALVQEFTRRGQERQADLVVAGGNCNAYSGLGDPYLPFREILGLLTGDVEARWAVGAISQVQAQRLWGLIPAAVQALVDNGPDLLDIFVPGPALVSRAMAAAPGRSGWLAHLEALVTSKAAGQGPANLGQNDLFEQYVKVLLALARQRPLLLVLDDLQWADAGSISLLFHLGRRLPGNRLLVIGIYRPAEVDLGRDGERHPLAAVVNELQRYYGDIQVDLSQAEGRAFIRALLDSEPNRLNEAFQEALYRHTQGNALFTVEMLRGLQERGDLVRAEDGRWVEGSALDWDTLPARVEGVIGERIGRLPLRLREAIKVASVEGEIFTAEVTARVQQVDEREMVGQLSGELDQQHRLVTGQGSRRLGPEGPRLSHYRFRHILFQRYIYRHLAEAERVYLHEAVGQELERLYGDQTEEVAVELARHFEAAGLVGKAVHYLHQAGRRAVRLSANVEALGHFNRALALLGTLPETPERDRQELALQIALVPPLMITKGYSALEVEQAASRALKLYQAASAEGSAPTVEETAQLFQMLYGLFSIKQVRNENFLALELAEQMLNLAQRQQDPLLLMPAHWAVGMMLFGLGEFALAQEHLEQSMALYDPGHHRSHILLFGQDQGSICLAYQGWNLWQLGYPDQALKRSQEAIALAEELAHPYSQLHGLIFNAHLCMRCGDWLAIQEHIETEIALCREHGFIFWQACPTLHRGKVLVEQGQVEEGIILIRQFLAAWRGQGAESTMSYLQSILADAYCKAGQAEEGLNTVAEALAAIEKTAEHFWEPELYRLKGELLLIQSEAEGEAEKCFWQAIELARRQGSKSLELRAVMSLSRLWQSQGKQTQAKQMLAETYGWFTEGFDTADLQEAKALLEML